MPSAVVFSSLSDHFQRTEGQRERTSQRETHPRDPRPTAAPKRPIPRRLESLKILVWLEEGPDAERVDEAEHEEEVKDITAELLVHYCARGIEMRRDLNWWLEIWRAFGVDAAMRIGFSAPGPRTGGAHCRRRNWRQFDDCVGLGDGILKGFAEPNVGGLRCSSTLNSPGPAFE
jgi:hypothetical protein